MRPEKTGLRARKMDNSRPILRVSAILLTIFSFCAFYLAGSSPDKTSTQFVVLFLGLLFLLYGLGGASGYKRIMRALAYPLIVPLSILVLGWSSYQLWLGASTQAITSWPGSILLQFSSQPGLFAVVVFVHLFVLVQCLASLYSLVWLKFSSRDIRD